MKKTLCIVGLISLISAACSNQPSNQVTTDSQTSSSTQPYTTPTTPVVKRGNYIDIQRINACNTSTDFCAVYSADIEHTFDENNNETDYVKDITSFSGGRLIFDDATIPGGGRDRGYNDYWTFSY